MNITRNIAFMPEDTLTKIGAIKFLRFALAGAVGLVDGKKLVESLPEPYTLGDLQNLVTDFRNGKIKEVEGIWYRMEVLG